MAEKAFVANGYISGPALDYFFREDTDDGISDQPPSPAAIAQLQQLISRGLASPNPNNPSLASKAQAIMAQYSIVGAPNYAGVNEISTEGNWAGQALGAIPGTPEGSQPTVQMRQLLLEALRLQESANIARQEAKRALEQGNEQLRLQAEKQAQDYELQARQMEQQSAQFAQTFGLQEWESQEKMKLAQAQFEREGRISEANLLGTLNGQTTLAGREQALREQQQRQAELEYGTRLASAPANIIEAAIYQSARSGGRIGAADTATVPQGAGAPGAMSTQADPLATLSGGAGAPTSGAAQVQTGGGVQDYSNTQVPVTAQMDALLRRAPITQSGMTQGQGYNTTLGMFQTDPNLRIQDANLDMVSLNNLGTNERANLLSALKAQRGAGAGEDFNDTLQRSKVNQQSAAVRRAY